MPTAYINIGSNMGNRRQLLDQAIAHVVNLSSSPASVRVSSVIESDPWGYDSPFPFLNVGIALEIDMDPVDLLHRLQEIERLMGSGDHRNPDGTYRDRLIDIDIIAIDDLVINTPELTIPHPRMHLRPFVLIPMSQIAPSWRHPLHKI